MKAAILREFGKDLVLDDVEVPKAGPEDALIKVRACGLCRSDLKVRDGVIGSRKLPMILGHEPAGDIVEVGTEVKNVNVGDRVTVNIHIPCQNCYYCRTGMETLCENLEVLGFTTNGAFAEYLKIPARNVIRLPNEISYQEGAIIADAVASPYHALIDKAKVGLGETVVIQGVGGLGLSTVQIAKASGAKVIAVDIDYRKLELAKKLGADEVVDTNKSDLEKEVKRLTDGKGAQVHIELVGIPSTIERGLNGLRSGGRFVIVGYSPEKFSAYPAVFVWKELEIIGANGNTRQNILDVIELARLGKIKPKLIVTDTFQLNEINHALEMLKAGRIEGRAVMTI